MHTNETQKIRENSWLETRCVNPLKNILNRR